MRPDAEYAERFGRRWTRRCGCGCGPTCRSAATSAAGSTPAPCWALAARHHADPIRAFTLTFDRPDYDEGAIAREMAAHAGADFHPIPIRAGRPGRPLRRRGLRRPRRCCFNAHGVAKYLLSRAVRDAGYKVVLTGEGSDEILAGYPHFRRDMLLHGTGGQDAAAVRPLLEQLQASNPVSRGLLLPDGEARALASVQARAGLRALLAGGERHDRLQAARACFAADFAAEFAGRDPYRELLDGLDVRRPARRPRAGAPVAVPVVQGGAAQLRPGGAGRPHGDGALGGGPGAVPGPPRRRAGPRPAGRAEDPGDDGEVRAARGGPAGADGDRLRPAQAPVPQPPGDARPDGRLNELVQETLRGPALASLPFFDQRRSSPCWTDCPRSTTGRGRRRIRS